MEITTGTIQLNTPDGKMEAYEARPKDGGARPAIIVLMEAFGLNSHIKDVTERISREGYVTIAPDLYHREPERVVPYAELQKAIGIMNRLQDPKVMSDVGAVISHLKSQKYVKASAIGITGFCMGGRFTYLGAAQHNKDIKAAVAFYGGGIPMGNPSPLDRTQEIQCPIYLLFGAKDQLIPQEHVEKIVKALTDAKKNFTHKVYPEAGHGFFCNERESYHADSAKDAWEKFKSFFARHLK
jgi:carboxymethylenebutenolidase